MFMLTSKSAWVIVISTLLMAVVAHGLLSYLIVIMNVGLMIINREVATWEKHHQCWPCAGFGLFIVLVSMLVMMKINWLAI